jgi:hypothetical protein
VYEFPRHNVASDEPISPGEPTGTTNRNLPSFPDRSVRANTLIVRLTQYGLRVPTGREKLNPGHNHDCGRYATDGGAFEWQVWHE